MGGCLLVGGPEYRIKIGATAYHFEMNRTCGPMPIYKDGNQRPLDATHRFWTVVTLWAQQGERVQDGWAVWDEPQEKPNRTRPREMKQCECGEQMYRDDKQSDWWCAACAMQERNKARLQRKGEQ